MCFFHQQSKTAQELKNRFNASFDEAANFVPREFNGFEYPKTPVITQKTPDKIELFQWGLIPSWAKDEKIRQHTLNARYETIREKPSFKHVLQNRCLIIADGFYEWQWLDLKGKRKQKYELILPEKELFAFAGLWSEWLNKSTGELIKTYTILTTQANSLMTVIHNTKKRMPIIVAKDSEQAWLEGKVFDMQNDQLKAIKIKSNLDLFD